MNGFKFALVGAVAAIALGAAGAAGAQTPPDSYQGKDLFGQALYAKGRNPVNVGTGDELLCQVADRLGSVLRPCDTLARLGGDEFTVLLPDVGPGDAQMVAARLQDSLREPIEIGGLTFRVTVSIGVVETTEATAPTDLLRWADAAMYEAKAQGRARAATFDDRMRAEVSERNQLDRDLTAAMERHEFVLHHQP